MKAEAETADQAQRLAKFIADTLEQGKDFVLSQAPDVVQQFIAWKRAEQTIIAVIAILAMIIGTYLARKTYLWFNSDEWDGDNPIPLFACVGCGASVLVGFLVFTLNLATLLQVWLAPKVYLVEFCARELQR